ncbi:MAG TPA: hypothetical protein VF950_02935 [Planctomycetota bacterium]
MGQAIYYCGQCSKQLREAHFDQGKAFRVDQTILCDECAPASARTQASRPAPKKGSSPSITTPRPRASQSTIVPPKPSSKLPLIGAAFGGIGVTLLIIVILLSGGSPPPPPPPPEPPKPPPVKAAAPVAPRKADGAPLDDARRYAKEHPDDLEGQIKLFQDVAFAHDGKPAGIEARNEVAALRAREIDAIKNDMTGLEREISGLVAAEAFSEVLRILDDAKHRQRGSQWKLAVGKRYREIEDRARVILDGLKTRARAAKEAGRTSELDTLRRQVGKWDLPPLLEELNAAIAAVEGPPAPASPEATMYGAAWQRTTAKRDFAAAAAELERLTLKEPETLERRAKDVEELKALAKIYPGLTPEIVKLAPTFLLIGGRSGRVLSIDEERVELSFDPKAPTSFFEWKELPLRSLLMLAKRSGVSPDLVARLDERLPEPSPEERASRELFYQAERDWRDMATRGKAIEAYAKLLASPFSKRAKERADGGREYYLVDLAFGGCVLPTSDGHLAATADAPGWVEAEYYARPSTTYRAWIQVGACCAEAAADLQAEQKLALKGLKSAHPGKEPKTPTAWSWVEVPLSKSAPGGARKIRLSGSKAGWGAGAVVVSATRTKAPTEEEAAQLAKKSEGRSNAPVLMPLDDFETDPLTWGYVGGWEFPGAKGSLEVEGAEAKAGKRSIRLTGDFSGGGAYVGTWRGWTPPPGWDVREIRLWARTDAHADMGVRLADTSEQCHQNRVELRRGEWQEIVLRISELVGREHWGGANDGRWHGPFKGFGLNIGRGTPKGQLWIDDVRVILEPK